MSVFARQVFFFGFASLALLVPNSHARAGGYELFEQAASSAGQASAATARPRDASAAWHNPAALADEGGLRAMLGLTLVLSDLHADEADLGWDIDNEAALGTPFYGYVSYAQNSWALGLSVNVPYASKVRWPTAGAQRFEIIASQPNFVRFAPFFAWSFGSFRLALGPHVDVGSLELLRNLDFIDVEGAVQIRMRGAGIGGHAAAYWQQDEFSLGFAYKSRTVVSLAGEAAFEAPPEFAEKTQDQRVEATWRNPDRLTLGLGYDFGELQLYADVSYTLWSVNEQLVIDFEREQTPDRVQQNDWENTFSVRLGAAIDLAEPLMLRAGILFDQSPVPAATLAPSSPDSDRIGGSLGVGVRVGDLQFDAFYQLLRLLGETSTSLDAPTSHYDGFAHFVGLSASVAVRER